MRPLIGVLAAGVAALSGGLATAASLHMFSYDPADAATRTAAGPLTFTFTRGVLKTTVLNVRSTEAPATADLRRADERGLGRGGLRGVVGAGAPARDLYQVEPDAQGEAMVSAFCPGARRAWMAFTPLKLNRDLKILVLGAPAKGGDVVVCRSLNFTFHGEWAFPAGRPIDPKEVAAPTRYPGAR
jgi:hypothetical protein